MTTEREIEDATREKELLFIAQHNAHGPDYWVWSRLYHRSLERLAELRRPRDLRRRMYRTDMAVKT
jgi:hypothetical protein